MRINVLPTPKAMGADAAVFIANKLNQAIASQGYARLLLSTGASQFDMLEELVRQDVAWNKVTMFHLDEYVGLSEQHPASFRKYLKERVVSKVPFAEAVFVNGEGDVKENITFLSNRIREAEIDVAAIGIGENGHIAFNDPPADFDTEESYIVVKLDERCRLQQVGEGWFPGMDAVPETAISMTVRQMLRAKCIVSVVPHAVKADAVQKTLAQEVNNLVPATILKTHPDWHLYLDAQSAQGFLK
ncbi:MAG TPA: glucosamine-6-phosphate deaminase [Clostridia bacterium]|nr:glucosamine-6-phosphate deaminase [Clostridia bacterium]